MLNLLSVFGDVDIATNGDSLSFGIVNGASLVPTLDTPLFVATVVGATLTIDYKTDQNGAANLTLRATDAQGPLSVEDTFLVTVTEQNDDPIPGDDDLEVLVGGPMIEDTSVTVSDAALLSNDRPGPATATDESAQPLDILSVQTTSLRGGRISRSGGLITYTPVANFNGSDSFTYIVRDNGTSAGILDRRTAVGTVTFNVAAVNDAPVLTPTGQRTLIGTHEDDVSNPAGTKISDLLGTTAGDVDVGTAVGVAILSVTGRNIGNWQYSTNNGSSYTPFPAVAPTAALVLGPNDFVRYIPDGLNGESATLTYRAWDQFDGNAAGSQLSTASNGGSSSFSTATDTARLTISDRNDAPVLTGAGRQLLGTSEDAPSPGDTISTFVAAISDVDLGALQGIAITGTHRSGPVAILFGWRRQLSRRGCCRG